MKIVARLWRKTKNKHNIMNEPKHMHIKQQQQQQEQQQHKIKFKSTAVARFTSHLVLDFNYSHEYQQQHTLTKFNSFRWPQLQFAFRSISLQACMHTYIYNTCVRVKWPILYVQNDIVCNLDRFLSLMKCLNFPIAVRVPSNFKHFVVT